MNSLQGFSSKEDMSFVYPLSKENHIFEIQPWDIIKLPCGCTSRPHTAGFVREPRQRREDAAALRQPLFHLHPRKQKGSGTQKTQKGSQEIK